MAEYISNGESALSVRNKLNSGLITPAEFSYSGNVVSITAPENAKHIEFFATIDYNSSYTYNLNGEVVTIKNFFNPGEEVYWSSGSIVHMVYNDGIWYVLCVPQKANEEDAIDQENDKKYITPKTAKKSFDNNIDEFFKIGDIRMSGRDLESEDGRYFACDGRAVSPYAYPDLANAISGRFGYPASSITDSESVVSGTQSLGNISAITTHQETGNIAYSISYNGNQGLWVYYYDNISKTTKYKFISYTEYCGTIVGLFYIKDTLYVICYGEYASQSKCVVKKIVGTTMTEIYADTELNSNARIRSAKIEGDVAYVSIEDAGVGCILLKISGDSVAKKKYGGDSNYHGSFILGDYVYWVYNDYSSNIKKANIKTFGNEENCSDSNVSKFFIAMENNGGEIRYSSLDGSSVAICDFRYTDEETDFYTGKSLFVLDCDDNGTLKYKEINIIQDIPIPYNAAWRSVNDDIVIYKNEERYSGFIVCNNNEGNQDRIVIFFDEYNGYLKSNNYFYLPYVGESNPYNNPSFYGLTSNSTLIGGGWAAAICCSAQFGSFGSYKTIYYPIRILRGPKQGFYIPDDGKNPGEIRSFIKAKN